VLNLILPSKVLNLKMLIVLCSFTAIGLPKAFAASCSKKELSKFNKNSSEEQKENFYTCLHKKGIYSISLPGLIGLVSRSTDPEFQNEKLSLALEKVPRKYEFFIFKRLYKKRLQVSPQVQSDLMYFLALNSFDRNKIKPALRYLSKQVGVDFKRYGQSKFLKAVIMTKLGKSDDAEALFTELAAGSFKAPNKKIKDKIISVSKLNIARIQIEQENYKDAVDGYRNVSFRDDQWFDGLVEMSWAMISRGDYESAIGNAGFINQSTSPYIYKPWLPVIESIGLLKMCQFPDAKKSVDYFKSKYQNTKTETVQNIKKNKNQSWYEFSSKILDTRVTKSSVKKIPPLLFYAAKSDVVVGHQRILNELIDEENALKKLKKSLKRYKRSTVYWLVSNRLKALNKGILSSQKNMGKAFKAKISSLFKEFNNLKKIADIVDFEVFARSSKSITLRIAGEKFKDKMKKAKQSESSWKYNGEFWTDEAGRFRSFLKNKCAEEG